MARIGSGLVRGVPVHLLSPSRPGGMECAMDLVSAYHSTQPAEVDFPAVVHGSPNFFYGRRSHAEHESFRVSSVAGPIEVVDNVSLAPPLPLRDGDRVEVRGEMVHDPGRLPVVHWTHHDPTGRRAGGFIRWQGRIYA